MDLFDLVFDSSFFVFELLFGFMFSIVPIIMIITVIRIIVRHAKTAHTTYTYQPPQYTPPKQDEPPKAVNCSRCGAPGVYYPGKVTICEYCDSPLEEEE